MFDFLLVLMIVFLLFYVFGIWYMWMLLIVFLICGLIKWELILLLLYWFFVLVLIVVDVFIGWFYIDNYKFVEFYWCLMLYCVVVVFFDLRVKIFLNNVCWIVGVVMFFVVFWKVILFFYILSLFFEFMFLIDECF